MSSNDELPDGQVDQSYEGIAEFWEAALERVKLQAERAASPNSDPLRVSMKPLRVIWNSNHHSDQ